MVISGNIREKKLKRQIRDHMGVVKSLGKSAMHGLKPEREEVLARLCSIDDTQSDKLV